jgi:ABC-type transport system involved in cytochrome c biogenesis permease subunit
MEGTKILLRVVIILAALFCYGATVLYFLGERSKSKALSVSGTKADRKKQKSGAQAVVEKPAILPFKDFNTESKIGLALHITGTVLNLIVMASNWVINGYVPFVSMYQVMTFISLVFPFMYLYSRYVQKLDWTLPYFSLCSAVFLTGVSAMNHTLVWHYPPALQSPFFLPHIMAYMLSYTLCAVAFIITILLIANDYKRKKAQRGGELLGAKSTKYENAIYSLIKTAFPFMVLGMFLGALWANECWGSYWGWDPKENWALITMGLYALYFHFRFIPSLRKFNKIILVLAFVALIITFVGVGAIYSTGEHTYT